MNKNCLMGLFFAISAIAFSVNAHADTVKITVPPADVSAYSEGRESRVLYCGVVDGKKRDSENRPLFVEGKVFKVEVPRGQESIEIERDKIPVGMVTVAVPATDGKAPGSPFAKFARTKVETHEGFHCLYNRQWDNKSVSFMGISVKKDVKEIRLTDQDRSASY